MQIDSFTVMVAACTGIVLFGIAFIYFWWQDRRSSWLGWWVWPFLLGGPAMALFIQRGVIDDWISIGLANALLMAAFGFAWQGMRVFTRRRPLVLGVVVPPALWGALCLAPGYTENTTLRIIVASAMVMVLSLLAARELWSDRAERLPSRAAAVAVLCSLAVLIGLRIPFVGYLPFPIGAGPMSSTALGIINLVILAHVGGFTMLMISLTKERREAEQRNFAMLDPLTGLMNRRAFIAAVERAERRATFARQATSLLVLDLDRFKQINDAFGHEVGDRVLIAFARLAESVTRSSDQLYRLGGEEFCFILPDTGLEEAIRIAERVRQALALCTVDVKGYAVSATVSIGVASTEYAGFDLQVLLEAADAAVYEAKGRGRDQVVVADATAVRRPVVGVRNVA